MHSRTNTFPFLAEIDARRIWNVRSKLVVRANLPSCVCFRSDIRGRSSLDERQGRGNAMEPYRLKDFARASGQLPFPTPSSSPWRFFRGFRMRSESRKKTLPLGNEASSSQRNEHLLRYCLSFRPRRRKKNAGGKWGDQFSGNSSVWKFPRGIDCRVKKIGFGFNSTRIWWRLKSRSFYSSGVCEITINIERSSKSLLILILNVFSSLCSSYCFIRVSNSLTKRFLIAMLFT